ncbi:HAD family phosphatase, partial [Brachyspira hampsonii]|nr:HAD family phosphatase [Brachyspira hampsonii]
SFNGAMITDKYYNIVYQQNLDSNIGKELINIDKKYNIYHQGFLADRWNVGFFDKKCIDFYVSIAKIDNYTIGFDDI